MANYKITEKRLQDLLEAEIVLTALENADVDKWRKYKKAIKTYQEKWAAHYLPTGSKPIDVPEMAKKLLKNYTVIK